MKRIILVLNAMAINLIVFSQTTYEYAYDNTGNRISRQVIELQNQQVHLNNDSLVSDNMDTVGIAANINNASFNHQNKDSVSKNNETATAERQYVDNIGEQQIVIYPNPTTGSLKIKITPFNTGSPGEITVYDLQSRLLQKVACTKELTLVDFETFARGSYILKVRIGGKEKEWKVVKE